MACFFKANIINLQRNIIGSVVTSFPQLSTVLSTPQDNPRETISWIIAEVCHFFGRPDFLTMCCLSYFNVNIKRFLIFSGMPL